MVRIPFHIVMNSNTQGGILMNYRLPALIVSFLFSLVFVGNANAKAKLPDLKAKLKPKVERKSDGKIPSFVPRTGLVYSEKTNLSEVLCKPKIMPIRPQHLVRKEQAELDAESEDGDDEGAGDDAAEAKQ